MCENITMRPIGTMRSVFHYKNGTPRQSSLCEAARGILTIDKNIFNNPEHSLEGLEQFSHAWIIFLFHKNNNIHTKAKVKPPRLNGHRIGVFSTRSPYRPNNIGLSLAKIDCVQGSSVHFSGIDLLDGTPVLDIKPYIPEYDNPKDSFSLIHSREMKEVLAAGNEIKSTVDNTDISKHASPKVQVITFNSASDDDVNKYSLDFNIKDDLVQQIVNDSSKQHVTDSTIQYVTDSSIQHVTDSSIQYVTDSSKQHVTDSRIQYVTDSSRQHVTDSSIQSVTDSSIQHVTDSSRQHVTDSSIQNVADSSRQHVAHSTIQHVTDSSIQHVADSSIQHVADSSIQSETDSSIQHVADSSIQSETDSSIQHVADSSIQSETDSSIQHVADSSIQSETDSSIQHVADSDIQSFSDLRRHGRGSGEATHKTNTEPFSSVVAPWLLNPPVVKLSITFTCEALDQLNKFSQQSSDPDYRLRMFVHADEAKRSIAEILREDPRSVYRRQHCPDSLYYFNLDVLHVTCWFDDGKAQVIRVKPVTLVPKLTQMSANAKFQVQGH